MPQRPELSGQLEKLCLAAYKAGEQVSGRASHLGTTEGDPAHCGWSQVRKNGGKDTHGTSYHDDEDGSNSEWLCCGGIVHGAKKRAWLLRKLQGIALSLPQPKGNRMLDLLGIQERKEKARKWN